jgi:hypothetical protein
MRNLSIYIIYFSILSFGVLGQNVLSENVKTNTVNQSSNSNKISAIYRDPFWPIGYWTEEIKKQFEPKKEKQKKEIDEWKKALSFLKVEGIINSGNKFYANVNGNMVQEKDIISVKFKGKRFRYRIKSINLKKVNFVPVK